MDNGYEWKKITQKTLAQDVFNRRRSLDGVKTLIKKYQCEIFNFVDLCSGVGFVVDHNPNTRVRIANAVTFSVKCFNPLKLYPLPGNIFRKWFASCFLFIHEHISNGKSYAVTTLLLTSGLHRWAWQQKNI